MTGYIPFDFSVFNKAPVTVATVAAVQAKKSAEPEECRGTSQVSPGQARKQTLRNVASVANVSGHTPETALSTPAAATHLPSHPRTCAGCGVADWLVTFGDRDGSWFHGKCRKEEAR